MRWPDGRLLAWVAVVTLALYLVTIGGAWQGIYNAVLREVTLTLGGGALIVWLAVAWARPAWRPRSVLPPAVGAALGSLVLSTAASRDPRQSVEYLGYAVLLAGCYLLLVRLLASAWFRPRFAGLVVGLGVALGLWALQATLAQWVDWWALVGRVTAPPLRPNSESLVYGNPSAVLTMVVLACSSAAAVLGVGTRGRAVATATLGLLAAFAVVSSGSRAGWLAVGLAVPATTLFWLAAPHRRATIAEWTRRGLARPAGRIVATLTILAIIAAVGVLGPALAGRLTLGGADLRGNYVVAALRMASEAPILGTGPGTWVIQRIHFTVAPETDYYIPHAHNLYAQTLAELGIVGCLAGLVLLASLAWLVRGALRDGDPTRRRWGWAAAFGLTYFAAHNLLDFYANMPAALFAAALPVAWLDATAVAAKAEPATAEPKAPEPKAPQGFAPAWLRPRQFGFGRPATVVALALVAVATGGLLLSEGPATMELSAVTLANEGRWAEADTEARRAVEADPAWAPAWFTMGLTAARAGDHGRAADAFRRVAQADDLPEAWLDLAAEEAAQGHGDAARIALHAATRLGLQRAAVAIAVGELAGRLGDTALQDEAYAAALALSPTLAGDPWWRSDPGRAAVFARVLPLAIERAGADGGWQVALAATDQRAGGPGAGDASRARALAERAPAGPGWATPVDIVDAWTGDQAAVERIVAATDARPLDTWTLAWAARLEARRGDRAAADHHRAWAETVSSGAGVSGMELRVSDRDLPGRTAEGTLAQFWGTYTYRRPTPWDMLVPGLVHLVAS